jgi:hypothetical protein
MEKYTLQQIKSIPPKVLLTIIGRLKKYLATNKQMQGIFDEYDVAIEELEFIPMAFSELDVSARCEHGIIYFSYELLCDGDFFKDYGYALHECTHWLQQTANTTATQGADDGNYLDNPYEVEGFQNQIEWMADNFGKEEAEDYTDKMLDHNGLEGEDKEEKKEELTKQVE